MCDFQPKAICVSQELLERVSHIIGNGNIFVGFIKPLLLTFAD